MVRTEDESKRVIVKILLVTVGGEGTMILIQTKVRYFISINVF